MNPNRLAHSIIATFIMLGLVFVALSFWLSLKEQPVARFPEIITTQPKTGR
ncbi:MAG: hypothetical protein ACOYM3_07250 [Terrimicrobiaceae bacterium]